MTKERSAGPQSFARARRLRAGARRSCAQIDLLESRVLLSSVGMEPEEAPLPPAFSPIIAASDVPTSTGSAPDVSGNGALHPLSDIPILHSYPAAPVKIYLDFDGAPAESWGDYSVPATPAYDIDHDPTTFSDRELANIREIWARVAEKFSPFNLDVTTEDPGSFGAGQAMHEIIGGDGSWINTSWGGATFVGGFADGQTDSFIFSANLTNGDPHNVAEATAHEIGHAFGLQHQSIYDANGVMINQYNSGNAQEAPIMGSDYSAARGVWWDGPDQTSATDIQDDMATIASLHNGFGYRPEDHGQTIATADALNVSGTSIAAAGVISSTHDTDTFSFASGAGVISFTASVAQFGPMLDLKLTLLDASGNTIAGADTASLGETLTATVPAGRYYLQVASHGNYGDVGQYTLIGSIVAAPQPAANPPVTLPQQDISPSPPVVVSLPAGATSNVIDLKLIANGRRKHAISLQWQAPPAKIKTLKIQRSTDGQHWSTLVHPRLRATNWIDHSSIRGHTYLYRIVIQTGTQTEQTKNASATAGS